MSENSRPDEIRAAVQNFDWSSYRFFQEIKIAVEELDYSDLSVNELSFSIGVDYDGETFSIEIMPDVLLLYNTNEHQWMFEPCNGDRYFLSPFFDQDYFEKRETPKSYDLKAEHHTFVYWLSSLPHSFSYPPFIESFPNINDEDSLGLLLNCIQNLSPEFKTRHDEINTRLFSLVGEIHNLMDTNPTESGHEWVIVIIEAIKNLNDYVTNNTDQIKNITEVVYGAYYMQVCKYLTRSN